MLNKPPALNSAQIVSLFTSWLIANSDPLRTLPSDESVSIIINFWRSLNPTFAEQVRMNFRIPRRKPKSTSYPESEE